MDARAKSVQERAVQEAKPGLTCLAGVLPLSAALAGRRAYPLHPIGRVQPFSAVRFRFVGSRVRSDERVEHEGPQRQARHHNAHAAVFEEGLPFLRGAGEGVGGHACFAGEA
jgi:hypothetical protein